MGLHSSEIKYTKQKEPLYFSAQYPMSHVTSNERVINVVRHFTRIGLKRSKFVLTSDN